MDIYDIFGLLEKKGVFFAEKDKKYLEDRWYGWVSPKQNGTKTDLQYSFKGPSRSCEDGAVRIKFKRTLFKDENPVGAKTLVFNFCRETKKEYKFLNVTEKNYILNSRRQNNL